MINTTETKEKKKDFLKIIDKRRIKHTIKRRKKNIATKNENQKHI